MLAFISTSCLYYMRSGPEVCLEGSGNVVREARNVPFFTKVELRGQGNIYLSQANQHELTLEVEDNLMEIIETYVQNNVLIIEHPQYSCLNNKKPINYYITMNDIEKLAVSGIGNIFGEQRIDTQKLDILLSGSSTVNLMLEARNLRTIISGVGDIRLKGRADVHEFVASGYGNLKAFEFITHNTKIVISGAGDVEAYADENLNVTISGSGDVFYKGGADVQSTISGSGIVQKTH